MSRKDYIALALALADSRPSPEDKAAYDNYRFDRSRFEDATEA